MKNKNKRNLKNVEERRSLMELTLLFSGVTFLILLTVLLVVGILVFVLFKTGFLTELTEKALNEASVAILLFILSLIIGAGITFFISRSTMKPMGRIINAMNELASGNFRVRLDLGKILCRNRSVREFMNNFNLMAEELEHTEILRSDFVNNFSHEFKTPIVSIAGFAKLLKRGNLTDKQKQEYTDIIEEESLRLSAMATNVLNLTRVENQAILTEITRFNLSEQIRGCMLLLEEKWSRKNLNLELNFAEYEICANEEMLKQVWINLLDNAIKFADEGGEVSVEIQQENGKTSVSVANTGCEIPAEEHKRIFNKFYQIDKSHSAQGTGIGLALCREIVKLHKGEISLISENGRTKFTVVLPEISA